MERLYNSSDFQMIDEDIQRRNAKIAENILCNAKLLREEVSQWEVMSKYESAGFFSRAG